MSETKRVNTRRRDKCFHDRAKVLQHWSVARVFISGQFWQNVNFTVAFLPFFLSKCKAQVAVTSDNRVSLHSCNSFQDVKNMQSIMLLNVSEWWQKGGDFFRKVCPTRLHTYPGNTFSVQLVVDSCATFCSAPGLLQDNCWWTQVCESVGGCHVQEKPGHLRWRHNTWTYLMFFFTYFTERQTQWVKTWPYFWPHCHWGIQFCFVFLIKDRLG